MFFLWVSDGFEVLVQSVTMILGSSYLLRWLLTALWRLVVAHSDMVLELKFDETRNISQKEHLLHYINSTARSKECGKMSKGTSITGLSYLSSLFFSAHVIIL